MSLHVRVDNKGRITIPKEIREKFGIREGDELIITLRRGEVILRKTEDPFKVLEELLGNLSFNRKLRKIAKEKALKELKRKSP